MLHKYSILNYSSSKLKCFKYYGLGKYLLDRKIALSVQHPLKISTNRTYSLNVQNRKYLQFPFYKLSKTQLELIRRSLSTSSSLYNNKKDPQNEENNNRSANNLWKIFFFWSFIFWIISLLFRNNEADHLGVAEYISWEEFKYEMLAKGEVQKLIFSVASKQLFVILHKGAVVKNKIVSIKLFP